VSNSARVTVSTLRRMKSEGQRIACLTAYDASFAALVDAAGVDVVLVGDSLGMVVQGHRTTVPVSLDDMCYHARAVARGCERALLMVDLPFLSFATPQQALASSARLMQEGMAEMVKLEATREHAPLVEKLASEGVPVCAHLGLTPQRIHKLGGYRVQGREEEAARGLVDDAELLDRAGADVLLLECVPSTLAARVAQAVAAPVIGIGAGPDCDGQILVIYDMLGVTPTRAPRFARDFLGDGGSVSAALGAYVDAVRDGSFPAPEHCFE